MANRNNDTINPNVVVLAIAAVVCFGTAAVVGLVVAIPDGANSGALITLILAFLGSSIAVMAGVMTIGNRVISATVDAKETAVAVKADTTALRNGELEQKIMDTLHKVLDARLKE